MSRFTLVFMLLVLLGVARMQGQGPVTFTGTTSDTVTIKLGGLGPMTNWAGLFGRIQLIDPTKLDVTGITGLLNPTGPRVDVTNPFGGPIIHLTSSWTSISVPTSPSHFRWANPSAPRQPISDTHITTSRVSSFLGYFNRTTAFGIVHSTTQTTTPTTPTTTTTLTTGGPPPRVPEPASVFTMGSGLGLFAIGLWFRRRRNNA